MSGNQYIWILSGICFLLSFGALTDNLVHNLALHRKAAQSSENSQLGAAENAVDGKRDASFQSGSCTNTEEESDPWWRVDLGNVYNIAAVMITNRDEHENMLDGAEIWIGKSVETNTTKNRCAVISHIPKGHTFYFSCSPVEGRYVTVLLRGSNKVLSLCEVEVFAANYVLFQERPIPNVALRGEATQSSTLSFAAASKAIDGRRNSYYSNWFCSHTAEGETNPWWRLDLQRTFVITSIKVTNRGDCCSERLDGAEIRVGNSLQNNGNDNPRCASISHIQAGKTSTYHCDGGNMEGRFVNVIIPGKSKTLTLCEVEVYTVPAVEPLQNVALNKPTAQSTTTQSGSASHAVSGCTSGIYKDGCCTHTVNGRDPWWRVDLLTVHKVGAVTIFNRVDCCAERLVGAQILIGNSLEHNGMKNPRCGVILSDTRTFTFQCNFMEGRYVTVMIPGDHEILTLCEVEVYAFPAVPEAETPPETLPATPPATPPPPTVSLLLGGRNVTVVGKKLCWSDALFYCRYYHWDLLSLGSQQEQSEVEKLLGHVSFPLTGYVWLGLHRYIMGKNWYWMSGDSMDFTKWPPGFIPHHSSSSCGGMASRESFLWEDLPCQELLNFICQSGAEDSAQRVYYYSTRIATSPQYSTPVLVLE